MIELDTVHKEYRLGKSTLVRALRGVSLRVDQGEFVAIMGPSGSGKSTLMHIIGCLDRPTRGRYLLGGEDVSKKTDDELARIRNRQIGFVFQSFNLLPQMNALENVELPLGYRGVSIPERRARARRALEAVGLADRMSHRPSELSGGQQQRVAIARALASEPSIILADEPTGNLDSRSSDELMQVFHRLHESGITIVFVTHEEEIAAHAARVVRLKDGMITSDQTLGEQRGVLGG